MKAFWGFIKLDICQQRFYQAAFSCNHHFIFHSFIPLFLLCDIISFGSHPSIRWEKTWIRKLKKISQEPKKLVKFFILYLDNE